MLKEDSVSCWFLVALLGENIVGTISYGPCGEDILNCTGNALGNVGELGSLYILPEYQGQGIGSVLIRAAANRMASQGIQRFSLDSGYRIAQQKWLNKFGKPYAVVPDYWGAESAHMVWLCEVKNYIGS
nr:GNAT family N-acetyltransferase [Paenibacillus brevis]